MQCNISYEMHGLLLLAQAWAAEQASETWSAHEAVLFGQSLFWRDIKLILQLSVSIIPIAIGVALC